MAKLAIFLAATAIVAAGCHDHLYDFGVSVIPTDGSVPDASLTGTGGRTATGGQTGTGGLARDGGGTGGVPDAGGATGGAGGSSSTDAGMVNTCNPNSPELQTDPANCGTCFHQCIVPNATPSCVAGQCKFTCLTGFYDADGNAMNGCECTKTNGGVEICDGIDNDCNGIVDDTFDLTSDVNNCGACNHQCAFPFAMASCENSVCKQGDCLPNFYDRDPNTPGCETECIKTNGGVEICDGLDNDCDGIADDNLAAATITCLGKGVCAGTQPTCQGQMGWICNYPSTYEPVEDMKFGCDGLDNDCNGQIDEPFQIGKTCTVGSGSCAGVGSWVCDNSMPGDHRCAGTTVAPQPEVCDGVDNDCDGKIDELDPSNHTTDDLLVYVSNTAMNVSVTMYGYEATRYDASGSSAGFDSTKRGCSVPGKLPWSNITMAEAETACELAGSGWRLCTATEWQAACLAGSPATPTKTNPAYIFPYGASYVKTTCNGNDYSASPATIPTGNAKSCTSIVTSSPLTELFDMSGNVKEWTATDLTTTKPLSNPTCTTPPCLFEMRGGAYDTPSFSVGGAAATAPGLQCDASVSAPYMTTGTNTTQGIDVRLPSVGFRCCFPGKFQ